MAKITFGEMRASGVSGILIYCSDFTCGHWTAAPADQWADDLSLSDIEARFTCQRCGRKGADVRPDYAVTQKAHRIRNGHQAVTLRRVKLRT